MATGPRYAVKFRRRRTNQTDYQKRINLLKSKLPRLVIRKSNKHITCQLVEYKTAGDIVLGSANSKQLEKLGWKHGKCNLPAAYLTAALVVKNSKVKKAIADTGMLTLKAGSRVYAALKGAVDAGLDMPHDAKVFPKEDRLSGKHISEQAAKDFAAVKLKIIGK